MPSYCLKRGENRESKNPKVRNTKNGRIMLLSKCVVCDSKNTKFINEQETRGLLSKLAAVKVPILSDLSIANI